MPSLPVATVTPARRLKGQPRVPGDKSVSHRCALRAAMADGPSRLVNDARGARGRSTVGCLRAPGVELRDASPCWDEVSKAGVRPGDAGAGGGRAVGQTLSLPGDFSSSSDFFSTLGRLVA